jgi:hypothetical protein
LLSKSTDDGLTRSKPIEITGQVKRPDWNWYATGPGAGIQLTSGRLVVPFDHIDTGKNSTESHVFYSDDHGATWKRGELLPALTDENQLVELADGATPWPSIGDEASVRSAAERGGEPAATAKVEGTGGTAGELEAPEGIIVYQLTKTGLMAKGTVQGTKYWKDEQLN